MVNLTINSIPVTVPEGTTILDAAASVDIEIPSLCYLKELNEISACRVCCVEVEGEGKLVPSCNNVVREGMVIRTNSPRALERAASIWSLFSRSTTTSAHLYPLGHLPAAEDCKRYGHSGCFLPHRPCTRQKGRLDDHVPALPRCKQVHQVHALHSGMRQGAVAVRLGYQRLGARTTIDVSGNRVIKQADCSLCGQCITHCRPALCANAMTRRRHMLRLAIRTA